MKTFYISDSGSETLDRLCKVVAQNVEEEIRVVCLVEIFVAAGATYWLAKEKEFKSRFPHKRIIFWYDVGDKGGYALGALRMGIQHIIFTGTKETFRKIMDIAQHYQAIVISALP